MTKRNIAGCCQQTSENKKIVDITQQCFAFTPQANFTSHNMNFHWKGEGNGIESRLPFKKFSNLWNYEDYNLEDCSRYYIFWGSRRALVSGQRLLRNLIKRLLDVRYLLQAVHNGDITLMELHLYFHENFYTFKCFTKITHHFLKFLVSTSNYN